MVPLPQLVQVARDYLRDYPRFFNVRLTGHGKDQAYEIPNENIDPDDLRVTVDGQPVTDYELFARDGFIRFTDPPDNESEIYMEGSFYEWLTNEDFSRYVRYAIAQFETSEGIDGLEDNLETNPDLQVIVALAGLVEALWAMWTEAGREIDVSSPEVQVPLRQRYAQLSQMIEVWSRELDERMKMLNVGRNKIEVLAMRRVSRTTGRLVPIFRSQEIEERGRPERVHLPPSDLTLTGED